MKKKLFIPVLALAAACLGTSFTAEAATVTGGSWNVDDEGWWYASDDFSDGYIKDGVHTIDGVTYAFEDGYVATGVYYGVTYDADGNTCYGYHYFNENGMVEFEGWSEFDGEWYYSEDGADIYVGQWLIYEGKDYYFKWDGTMATSETAPYYNSELDEIQYYVVDENGNPQKGGWVQAYAGDYDRSASDLSWYYVGDDGVAASEWLKEGDSWYYLSSDGRMRTDYWLNDGKDADGKAIRYYFGNDGKMVTGWYNRSTGLSKTGDWVYCNADGTAATGWVQSTDGNDWYYVSSGDVYQGSWVYKYEAEDGTIGYEHTSGAEELTRYYFGADGKMVKGWYDLSTSNDDGEVWNVGWIYTDPSTGEAFDGWLNNGGSWYYINNGYMVQAGTIDTDYPEWDDYAGEDGSMNSDEYDEYLKDAYSADRVAEDTYVFNAAGQLVTGGWYKYNYTGGSTWYYAQATGQGYNGWLNENGTWYYIKYGKLLVNTMTPDGYFVGADGAMIN